MAPSRTRHAGRSGKDGKADDVAFLLMVPSARGKPLPAAARRGCSEDNRSAGKGNCFCLTIDWLVEIDFGLAAGPIDWANVPT
ncbi:hypothetical protein A9K66_07365 [Mesorhizobium sp. AA23]|nr:hypothetical protein A9K66_07365 [Mesorhizobium sp. AA23]TIO11953.1 MAG: hypothetical protein E5X96_12790 [Mesorhizobium sp.]